MSNGRFLPALGAEGPAVDSRSQRGTWINRSWGPSRPNAMKLRTSKAKNRSSAPQCRSAGSASDKARPCRKSRQEIQKVGPKMAAWIANNKKGGKR